MANATTINLTAGVPTGPAGAATVSSLDGVFQTANGPIAVKPASTPAAITDPALVVAISPNGFVSNPNGSALSAASTPVVIASDQSQVAVYETPSITNGLSLFSGIINATPSNAANAQNVKASAGKVYKIEAFNSSATGCWLKLFNLAVAPTVGTSVPVWRQWVPAGGGISSVISGGGLTFGTGISLDVTGLLPDADSTALVNSTSVSVNLGYK